MRIPIAAGTPPPEAIDGSIAEGAHYVLPEDHRLSIARIAGLLLANGRVDQARRRTIGVVICTKLDRLFRSVRHLVAVAEELKVLGVDLVVLDQQIDTTTSVGRLIFHVLAAIGEFEGDLIRERVTAGVRRARARRLRWGRPPEVVIDVPRARELQAQGHSLRAIARELHVHPTQVRRALDPADG